MSLAATKPCTNCFNQTATPATQKPSIPVHEMCACYRPKVPSPG